MMSFINSYIRYLNLIRKYSGRKLYVVIFLVFMAALLEGVGLTLILPLLQSNQETSSEEENSFIISLFQNVGLYELTIGKLFVIIWLIFMVKGLITFLSGVVNGVISNKLLFEMKSELLAKYRNLNFVYFTTKDSGHFTNIINEQVNRSLTFFQEFSKFTASLGTGLIYICLAFAVNWKFSLFAIISGFLTILCLKRLASLTRENSRKNVLEASRLNKLLIQIIQGFKYLKATNEFATLNGKVRSIIQTVNKNNLKNKYLSAFSGSISEPLIVGLILSIVFIQTIYFNTDFSSILVAIALFYRTMNYLLLSQNNWQTAMAYAVSLEKVDQEMNQAKNQNEPNGIHLLKDFSKEIAFSNVKFGYGNNQIIKGIDLTIRKNQTVAIVGPSGAGKSTVLDLINLLCQPTSGTIKIDNYNATDLEKGSWRSLLGYINQDVFIFNDDVRSNITLWDDSNDQKINEAAQLAHCTEFINELPDGFDTLLGERGINLSGGQKQRLCIARELYKQPSVLLLDEATSALDSESESLIKQSLNDLKGKVTVIMVAHRLSTIRHADLIYVMRNGKIIDQGTFEELSAKPDTWFSKIVEMQGMNSELIN